MIQLIDGPKNRIELIEALERRYFCEVGQPRSHHEFAGDDYYYRVIGFQIGQPFDQTEELLCLGLWRMISEAIPDMTRIWWRYENKIQRTTIQHFAGFNYDTMEVPDIGTWEAERIYTRIATPKWNNPEEFSRDSITANFGIGPELLAKLIVPESI